MYMEKVKIDFSQLREYLKNEYPDDVDWKAFFKMWLDAKGFDYGKNDKDIVDGCGDGGIDAIANPPKGYSELKTIVLQSKLYDKKVPSKQFESFFNAVSALKSDSKEEFEIWLSTVKKKSLRPVYRDLWKIKNELRFVIVSSAELAQSDLRLAKRLGIEVENKERILAVFKDMALGKTPRPEEVSFAAVGKISTIISSESHALKVFPVRLVDLADAYQQHKQNLFAGNVRYALKGKSSGVNEGIAETLKIKPEEFAFFHNGITVVCKKLKKSGKKIVLTSPSIVNGAQTVSYLGQSIARDKISPSATVLVKCVEVNYDGGFEEYETDIAMSSNTQNKVSISDLSVINPHLVSLERFFAASNCFLERKRGAQHSGSPSVKISKDRLLQLFVAIDSRTGPSHTKDKQRIYKTQSRRLFSQYASNLDAKRDAVFIAKLDKVARDSIKKFKTEGSRGKNKQRKISLSYFTIFSILVLLIKEGKQWKPIKNDFIANNFDNDYMQALDSDIRLITRSVLSFVKKDGDRNDSAFFKNRDKVNNLTEKLKKSLLKKIKFTKI